MAAVHCDLRLFNLHVRVYLEGVEMTTDPLRPGTLKEWRAVIQREKATLSIREKLALVFTLIRVAVKLGGVSKAQWNTRMNTCLNCPIYDPVLRRCRPYDASQLGCGCYAPFLALLRQPYSNPGCWARQHPCPATQAMGWI